MTTKKLRHGFANELAFSHWTTSSDERSKIARPEGYRRTRYRKISILQEMKDPRDLSSPFRPQINILDKLTIYNHQLFKHTTTQ